MNGRDVTGEFFRTSRRDFDAKHQFTHLPMLFWLQALGRCTAGEALTRRHVAARRMPLSLDVQQERYPSNERLETRPSTEAGSGGSRVRS